MPVSRFDSDVPKSFASVPNNRKNLRLNSVSLSSATSLSPVLKTLHATSPRLVPFSTIPPPREPDFPRRPRPSLQFRGCSVADPSRRFDGNARVPSSATRESSQRYYARCALSRKLQFRFGLVDLVVRDTLTELRTENGVQRALVQGSYELLNCFVTVRPVSSRVRYRSLPAARLPLSPSPSCSRDSPPRPDRSCQRYASRQSCRRVPRMPGIVSGIVLAYPLTSYPWDSNVGKSIPGHHCLPTEIRRTDRGGITVA